MDFMLSFVLLYHTFRARIAFECNIISLVLCQPEPRLEGERSRACRRISTGAGHNYEYELRHISPSPTPSAARSPAKSRRRTAPALIKAAIQLLFTPIYTRIGR